ncbi:endopeptidase IV [Campylobacterota bacterium]|nr:endopeptidase IV [Campylobacterota bacterium]GHV05408.1 endopeptidase IV [Campylobacterota bacterium]
MEDFKQFCRVITAPIVFIQNHFKAVMLVLIVSLFVFATPQQQTMTNLYRIELYGPILEADSFLRQVKAAGDERIKGVLLVVDSPGGSVPPSVEMMMALKKLAEQKPVVAYSAGVMASGSYYASVWSNEIIANPGSIVGSIGVIMEGFNAADLLDKLGVKMRVVKAGDLKEAGTFYREWTASEKAQLEAVVGETYKMFVADVAAARDLSAADHKSFADGRVFTASQALEVGLIDSLGSIETAQARVVELSGVKDPFWNEKSEFDKVLERLEQGAQTAVVKLFATTIKSQL